MTPERRKVVILSSLIVLVICAVLSSRRFPHHDAFRLASDVLMLLNFWLLYRYNSRRRQPDTLIHLFPESAANFKERP
jgi:hypothetical protein